MKNIKLQVASLVLALGLTSLHAGNDLEVILDSNNKKVYVTDPESPIVYVGKRELDFEFTDYEVTENMILLRSEDGQSECVFLGRLLLPQQNNLMSNDF